MRHRLVFTILKTVLCYSTLAAAKETRQYEWSIVKPTFGMPHYYRQCFRLLLANIHFLLSYPGTSVCLHIISVV